MRTLVALFVIVAALTGCKTTPSKIIATSAVTVDKAMKAWAVYVVDGHATPAQRVKVRELQTKYYNAEDKLLVAYALYERVGVVETWQEAAQEFIAAQQLLIETIEIFTGKAKQ